MWNVGGEIIYFVMSEIWTVMSEFVLQLLSPWWQWSWYLMSMWTFIIQILSHRWQFVVSKQSQNELLAQTLVDSFYHIFGRNWFLQIDLIFFHMPHACLQPVFWFLILSSTAVVLPYKYDFYSLAMDWMYIIF